jgi:hypothetical protein
MNQKENRYTTHLNYITWKILREVLYMPPLSSYPHPSTFHELCASVNTLRCSIYVFVRQKKRFVCRKMILGVGSREVIDIYCTCIHSNKCELILFIVHPRWSKFYKMCRQVGQLKYSPFFKRNWDVNLKDRNRNKK